MSLSRDSRQERKLKALRRAQFRLKQSLERIDWEEDTLLPEIEALKSGKSVHVTMHLIEGGEKEVRAQLEQSLDAFFEFYPEI